MTCLAVCWWQTNREDTQGEVDIDWRDHT